MTTEIRPWLQHVRRVVEARSYSKRREITIGEDEPEAYDEWGAPSNFEHESESKKAPRSSSRERYTYQEEARYFLLKEQDQSLGGDEDPNFGTRPGFKIDDEDGLDEETKAALEGAVAQLQADLEKIENVPTLNISFGDEINLCRSFAMNGPGGEQHRFYMTARLNLTNYSGYLPIIEPTFLAPSWQNPYDFIGAGSDA